MAITPGEFVEMLRLWEQCCTDVGEGWWVASRELRLLEEKAGVWMDMNHSDTEGFQAAVMAALKEVA